MTRRPLPFFSNRCRLDGDLHLPDGPTADTPCPVIVAASGYQGQKIIHPERFARAMNPAGFAVLAFDYRGFGLSEGERGRLAPQDWSEDIRAAIDRLTTVQDVDINRVGLIGWGLGGGVAVAEASEDPRVRAVAAINGIGDGWRSTRAMHDSASWDRLLERINEDRGRRAVQGRSEIVDPWDIVRLDLDTDTDAYVQTELYKAPGFGTGVTLESADLLLRFCPELTASRIAPRPLLIVHGTDNRLHYPAEAHSLYDHAHEPKELVLLEGSGHTEWMFDDHPTFAQLSTLLQQFFARWMASETSSADRAVTPATAAHVSFDGAPLHGDVSTPPPDFAKESTARTSPNRERQLH